jgi:hypothetical protein
MDINTVMPGQQRGVTFGGFVFGAFLLVLLGISALKVVPAYMEAAKIKNVFVVLANDPDLQKASIRDIRVAFEKHASIEGIKMIKPEEIEVTSDDGRLRLSASYSVKVPVSGNVSLLMEFNPTSGK